MPQPITTEECFTKKQIAFLRAYSEFMSHLQQYNKGTTSREAGLRIEEMKRNVMSIASDSGINFASMNQFCKTKNMAYFNFDNPSHRSDILPEIVAMNGPTYYSHLSKADYGRVLDFRAKTIAEHHNKLKLLDDGARGIQTLGAYHAGLSVAGGLLELALPQLEQKISVEEVNACPTFWATPQAAGISRDHLTSDAIAKTNLYAAIHRDEEQRLQRALLEKIAAVRESKQINAVPTAKDEQAYRGLVLKYMEDQLIQEIADDPRALEIQRAYQEKCREFAAGSAKHVAAHMEYENQLTIRRKELKAQRDDKHADVEHRETWYRLGQNTAEFADSLSILTGSKNVRQFGQAISGAFQAHKGFTDMAKAAASIAAEGVGVTNMGMMIGGCTAVLGVTLMCMQFMQEEESEKDGLSETLHAIYTSIQAMWSEMRSSFAETWRMLETMEEHNVKRFCITKAYLEQIISDIARTRHQQEIGFARLQAQLGRMHMELAAGLNDVLDQPCLQAIEEIRQGDAAYLEAHYPSVVSRLLTYLVKDAASEIKTGYMSPPLDSQKTTDALRPSHRMKPLGLLAAVANSFKPDFVCNPVGLIGGDSWVQVSQIYDDLIRYRGIHQEAERARIISEVSTVHSKVTQICQLLQAFVTPATGKPLLDAVIAHYAENLAKALTCVKEVLEQERRRINREKLSNDQMSRDAIADIENKMLLRLDETFEETSQRLTGTSTALWQKPIFENSTFKNVTSRSAEAKDLPTVCNLLPITHYYSLKYNSPELTSLGSERLKSLQDWCNLQLERGDKRQCWQDAARFLFSLETNPILNLSFTYGVSKDTGGLWAINTWINGNRITAINFIHHIQINAANVPVAVTQFVPPVYPAALFASQLTSAKASIDTSPYHRDCHPITPLTTEATLVSAVEPGLTSILNTGCQRSASALSAKKSFTDALHQMELSRLFITACLERLGVVLTTQQKDLFMSEQKIKDLLEKLETTPSVSVVKELLTCLDLGKLPIASASARATTPLAILQNAMWDLVPRDMTLVPLYQQMHEADEKLTRLADALRSMPVRPATVQEPTQHVQPDVAREMQALREDNHQLKAKLEETNAKLQAMQGTMDQLLKMMQQMSRSTPAPATGSSENRSVHSPRLFVGSSPVS